MELTKSQRALLAMPSRWPPIMLGITLSLFISAIFTCNFASRIMPASIVGSGSTPSVWAPSPTSITTFSSQLFIILFRNSYSNAAPHEHKTSSFSGGPSPKTLAQAPVPYRTSTDPLSFAELNEERDGNVEVSKDAEFVHYNESLPSQEASPSNKPLDAGSLLGRKVYMDIAPAPTRPMNETEPLMNATLSLNGEGRLAINHLSERLRNNSLKAPPPSSGSISEPFRDGSSLPLPGNDSKISFTNATNTVKGINDLAPSSLQNSTNAQVCDVSIGQWVKDDSYPLYRPGTCPFVDEAFSCQRNGRPDSKYNRWRWAPRDCIVPRFNGTDLLERLRGKRLVFVGDSLNRNQWESMLCMLRESLRDKRRIVQIHGGRISKLPGAYVFKFLDYECKVEFYTSQYLVDKQEGINQNQFTIRLDRMDKSERRWRKANVLVFNTGHWWTSDKIGEGDNRFQVGSTVHPKLDVTMAYNKALSTWAKWVDTYVNLQNTSVFFRGYSPVHYIGGQWNSGGQCQDETEPIFDESFLTSYPSRMQVLEGVLHEMKLPVHVLNITRLSDYRKDAHPATYGHAPHHVVQHQDCSHWCLPGLPDTWNELLYFALTKQSLTAP